jgi:hypothetical protein
MELSKELKEKVDKAENKEEAKKILTEAGVALDDTELDQIAGGSELRYRPKLVRL